MFVLGQARLREPPTWHPATFLNLEQLLQRELDETFELVIPTSFFHSGVAEPNLRVAAAKEVKKWLRCS